MTGAIAALAILVGDRTPAVLSAVLLALVTGLVITNLRSLPTALAPGIDVAAKRILRLGVALLGARLTLGDVADIGGPSLLVVVATMTTAFVTVALVGRLAGISPQLGILLGTGTAVCGNSAIVAASPIIDAEDRQVSYAVATITIFGTIALVLFPVIGRAMGLSDEVFGVWAGLAINDTSQVVAAGAAYSERALEHATVVKLVRNALMGPILIGLTLWMGRRHRRSHEAANVEGAGDAPPAGGAVAATPAEGAAATHVAHAADMADAARVADPAVERARPGAGTGAGSRTPPTAGRSNLWGATRSAVPPFVLAFIVLAGVRSAGLISDDLADALGTVSAVAITVAIAGVGLKTRIAELTSVGIRPVLVGLAAASSLAVVALPLAHVVVG